jgi:nucleotide-binding universal stress UspA family protein
MFNKILVALDNGAGWESVYEQGLDLAKATGSKIMLLHVLSPIDDPYINPVLMQPETIYPSLQTEAMNKYMQAWHELKQERLQWLRSLTQSSINLGVETECNQQIGDAGRLICEFARNWPANLIVVGRRGRTGIRELFLGSVSNYVLHHASCSVLTVQGTNNSEQERVTTDL